MKRLFNTLLLFSLPSLPTVIAQNATQPEIRHGVVSAPTGRGTFNIVYTCIITLSLCVYTALHLNLCAEDSTVQRIVKKAQGTGRGLLMPEHQVVQSYGDWLEAHKLHKDWCDYFNVKKGSKEDRLGIEGAFFVVMGGYSLGLDLSESIFPSILTPQGFMDLTKTGLINPEAIDKNQIRDKGKADALGKMLVLIQASWMLVQCVVRKFCGLPITLLELHTVMHILCAAVMYFFWWDKPLDATEPISVIEDATLGMILSMSCDEYRRFRFEAHPQHDGVKTGRVFIQDYSNDEVTEIPIDDVIENVIFVSNDGSKSIPYDKPEKWMPDGRSLVFRGGKDAFRSSGRLPKGTIAIFEGEKLVYENNFSISCEPATEPLRRQLLTVKDLQNLQLMASAARSGGYDKYTESTLSTIMFKKLYTHALTRPPLNMYNFNYISTLRAVYQDYSMYWLAKPEHRAFIPLTILYSVGHATAWNSYFPTPLERWLWRACCIMITITPAAIYVCYKLIMLWTARQEGLDPTQKLLAERRFLRKPFLLQIFPESQIRRVQGPILAYILRWFLILALFAFGSVRYFMTLEAFISLRSMPQAMYETVGWEGFWPHVT